MERDDGRKPSPQEIGELMRLGTGLAYGERNTFMNAALDLMLDPVAMVDASFRWRYANRHAANRLGIPYGWRRCDLVGRRPAREGQTAVLRSLDSSLRDDYLVAAQASKQPLM